MDWRGRSIRRTAIASRPRNQSAEKQPTSSLAARRRSPEPTTRSMSCRRTGGLANLWFVGDSDIMCHPILVPSSRNSTSPTPESERSGTHKKNEVIYHVNDLDAAQSPRVRRHSHIVDQNVGQSRVSNESTHERVQLCQDPQTEFALQRESQAVGPRSATSCEISSWPHDPAGDTGILSNASNAVGQRSARATLPWLHVGQFDASNTQRWKVRNRVVRARDIAASAHLRALHSSQASIQAVIHDAVLAGLLPKHPFDDSIVQRSLETATSTYPSVSRR